MNDLSFAQMIKIPDIIIGIGSFLLIELAMKRDDVVSFKPKSLKPYFGDEIKATIKIDNKNELFKYITTENQKLKTKTFRYRFNGSHDKIFRIISSML